MITFVELISEKKTSKKRKNQKKRTAKGVKGKIFDKKVKSKLAKIVAKNARKGK